MADDVSIKFSADIGDLQKGMAQANAAIAATTTAFRSGADGVDAAFASLSQTYAASLAQRTAATQAASDEQLAIARVADRGSYDIALNGIKTQESLVKEAAQTAQISRGEELTALLQLEAQRETIARDHLDFVKSTYAEGTLAYANAQRQLEELESQSALKRQQTEASVNSQIYAEYRRSYEQIGSSVSSGIVGMIRGQETLAQAAQNVALSIVESFVQARVKMVADWLAGEATKVATTQASEAAQTAATTAAVTARTGAEQAGLATSLAGTVGQVLKTITASAAETFAGIFGFLSPLLGPAAAAPAAAGQASVLAVAAAVPSFASGAWSLPADMLANVHAGEMIVPAGAAAGLRSAAGGLSALAGWAAPGLAVSAPGGSGGRGAASSSGGAVHVHHATTFSVQAVDGRSVKRWFGANGKAILGSINDAVRQGAHLGFSKLTRG